LPAPHREYAGASIRAPVCFLRPPLSSRTAGFPRSGWKRRPIFMEPARHACSLSEMVRIRGPRYGLLHASSGWLATDTRTLSSSQAFRARPSSPRAPLLQRHYPPSLLLRAHAQIPVPLISISCFALIEDALAACTIYGWSPGPSRFGPPFFPEVLRPLYRRFDECIEPVLPRRHRPSPLYPGLGSPQNSRKRLPAGLPFRYGRHSFMLRPSSLLALLAVRHLQLAPEDVLHPSLPSIRYLLDRRICYPADWSIAGAGLSPTRKAAAVGCTAKLEVAESGESAQPR